MLKKSAAIVLMLCSFCIGQTQTLKEGEAYQSNRKIESSRFLCNTNMDRIYAITRSGGNFFYDDIWITEYDQNLNKKNEALLLGFKKQKQDIFQKAVYFNDKIYMLTYGDPYRKPVRDFRAWEIDPMNLTLSGSLVLAEEPKKSNIVFSGGYVLETYNQQKKAVLVNRHPMQGGEQEINISISWFDEDFAQSRVHHYPVRIPENQTLLGTAFKVDETGRVIGLFTTDQSVILTRFTKDSDISSSETVFEYSDVYKIRQIEFSNNKFSGVIALEKISAFNITHILYFTEEPDGVIAKNLIEINMDWFAQNGSPLARDVLKIKEKDNDIKCLPFHMHQLHRLKGKDYLVMSSVYNIGADPQRSVPGTDFFDDIFIFPLNLVDKTTAPLLTIPRTHKQGTFDDWTFVDEEDFSGEQTLHILFNDMKANLHSEQNRSDLSMGKKAAMVDHVLRENGTVSVEILCDYEFSPYHIPLSNTGKVGSHVFMLGSDSKNFKLFGLRLE